MNAKLATSRAGHSPVQRLIPIHDDGHGGKYAPGRRLSAILAFITVMLAITAMLGWVLRLDTLIQIRPTFAPMQFNTALCFALCGIAYLLLELRQRTAMAMSIVVIAIAGTALAEYALGTSIGLDSLFVTPYVTEKTSHAGRMAPNTAIAFVLCASALVTAARKRRPRYGSFVLSAIGASMFALGGLALVGYLIGLESAFGWGRMTRMAVHTAVGFMMLGCCVMTQSLRLSSAKTNRRARMAPTVIVAIGLITTFATTLHLSELLDREYFATQRANVTAAAERIASAIELRVMAFTRVTSQATLNQDLDEQIAICSRIAIETPIKNLAIGIVRLEANEVRWFNEVDAIGEAGNPPVNIFEAIRQRSRAKRPHFIHTSDAAGHHDTIWMFTNLHGDGDRTRIVAGRLRVDSLLTENDVATMMKLQLRAGLEAPGAASEAIRVATTMRLGGKPWRLTTSLAVPMRSGSFLPETVLSVGLLITLMVSIAVWLALDRAATLRQVVAAHTELAGRTDELNLALECGGIGAWSLKIDSGTLVGDARFTAMIADEPLQAPATLEQFLQMADPSQRTGVQRIIAESIATLSPFEFELSIEHPDGSTRYISTRGQVYSSEGRATMLRCVSWDVTQQKLIESRCREAERRLELAVESGDVGMWEWNLHTDEVWVSAHWWSQLGEDSEESQVTFDFWLQRVHPDDREIASVRVKDYIDGRTAIYESAFRMRHRDGGYRWILAKGERHCDSLGRHSMMTGVHTDITAVKEAQAALAEYACELEERNRELDEFAYVASHDLQEPLRKLISFSDLLPRDLPGELPERAATDLRFIRESALRMRTLILDMLELTRAGKSQLKCENVDLIDCISEARSSLEERIEATGADIDCGALPAIRGDRRLLNQLFQNLISNALKFRKPGQSPTITVSAQTVGHETVFAVSDNGIGIPPQASNTIFGAFKRLHGRSDYEGNGIGLAICHKAVQRHGGRIWVESVPGEGATFRFTLATVSEGAVQHAMS